MRVRTFISIILKLTSRVVGALLLLILCQGCYTALLFGLLLPMLVSSFSSELVAQSSSTVPHRTTRCAGSVRKNAAKKNNKSADWAQKNKKSSKQKHHHTSCDQTVTADERCCSKCVDAFVVEVSFLLGAFRERPLPSPAFILPFSWSVSER